MPLSHSSSEGTILRRHASPFAAVVLALLVAAGAGTAYALLGSGSSAPDRGGATASGRPSGAWDACKQPILGTGSTVPPERVGRWPFRVAARGVFGAMAAAPGGGAFALQACGADESALRVVRFGADGRPLAVSRLFEGAALLASGMGTTSAALFVVTAHLSLTPGSLLPYELVVFRLNPETLDVESSVGLGRGDDARLVTVGRGVLVSTGPVLYGLSPTPSGRVSRAELAGMSPAVVTHLAFDPTSGLAALSTLVPGATGGSSAELETLRVKESADHVPIAASFSARRPLSAGVSVQSLAAARGVAFYAAGGFSTVTYSAPLASLDPASPLPGGTTLGEVGLAASGGTVYVFSAASVFCTVDSSGVEVASTKPSGQAEYLTAMLPAVSTAWVETAGGIGQLTLPPRCGRAAGRA